MRQPEARRLAWPGVSSVSGYRDDFFLKVAAARRLGDVDLVVRVVEQRRTVLLAELRDLAALGSAGGASTYDSLLTAAAELSVKGQLELLDRMQDAAPALVAEAAVVRGESAGSADGAGTASGLRAG